MIPSCKTLYMEKPVADAWAGRDPFEVARQQQGEIYREKEGRRTLRFEIDGRFYFLKLHQGIGWFEVIKNIVQFRLPVIGAKNEWQAISRLHQIGVHTMHVVAYGSRGINPSSQLSFLITDELTDTLSLEDLCAKWPENPPDFRFKQVLIKQLAEIASKLHGSGINHRDFYLCHFLADISMGENKLSAENLKLYVVDLHRAQLRKKTPLRWLIKDLGGLYFSALDIGLTSRDVLRFMSIYSGVPLRELVRQKRFWLKIQERARQIQLRYRGVEPKFPL